MGRARGTTTHPAIPSRRQPAPESVERELEREWIAADAQAPRTQCVSLPSAYHPERNEDRVLCDPVGGVAAVFDGMGGQAGGELAARAAAGAFAAELEHLPEGLAERRDWLVRAVAQAANAVKASQRLHAKTAKTQGTTALALALAEGRALVVSVGDSRVYRYSQGLLSCLNAPHSSKPQLQQRLERLEEVSSRTELDSDPPLWTLFANRHIIDVELGTLKTSPTLSEHELAAGDLLIVCSDGVSDNLTGTEMAALVRSAASAGPQEVAQALAVAAQTRAQSQHLRAKPDDISAACLQA